MFSCIYFRPIFIYRYVENTGEYMDFYFPKGPNEIKRKLLDGLIVSVSKLICHCEYHIDAFKLYVYCIVMYIFVIPLYSPHSRYPGYL